MAIGDHRPLSVANRKIDPTRRPARGVRPDGTPDDNDRVEIGPTTLAYSEWQRDAVEAPDLDALRAYRLQRIRGELEKRDLAAVLVWDPLNIRYATDSTNMQLWCSHNSTRACFVATDGPVVMFDYPSAVHLTDYLPLVDEARPAHTFFYFSSGARCPEFAEKFTDEIEDLLRQHGGGNRRVAVDKMELPGVRAFERRGISVENGQAVMEHARTIKNANELKAMRCAIHTCETSMRAMREAMEPGMTENDLWAVLHAENIRRGGEWIETRLLSSGPRTNPWFQECGPRVIGEGDIVAFDTDLIGPYGYCCDISRTWICGDARPTNEQRHLYQIATEHIHTNRSLLKAGLSFREFSERSHRLPDEYRALRYGAMIHGVGLCDEYPVVKYPEDMEKSGYDGYFEEGMTICVEAYVGAEGGSCGVKLEDQVLVTANGFESLSTYPLEAAFLD